MFNYVDYPVMLIEKNEPNHSSREKNHAELLNEAFSALEKYNVSQVFDAEFSKKHLR